MFSCKRCGYQTDVKINIKGHLTRIKPCETIHCDTDRAILLNEIYQKNGDYSCDKCNKVFTHQSSKYRHQRSCNTFATENDRLKDELKTIKKQMKLLQLSVAGNLIAAPAPTSMVNHGTIHNTDNSQNINNFVNINVTNNIHNISDTDFSQISLREIKSDINPYTHPSDFIPILMRLIYFNKDFPKNNNIKLINESQSEVFEAGKWVPKSTPDVFKIALFLIENAIDDKLSELSEYDRICNYMFSTCTFKRNLDYIKQVQKPDFNINISESPWGSSYSQLKVYSDSIH